MLYVTIPSYRHTIMPLDHRITSHHITSHHITSHHITSHHITSHHITSYMSYVSYVMYVMYHGSFVVKYVLLWYNMSYHDISFHNIVYRIISCRILYPIMTCHVIAHHGVWQGIVLQCTVLYWCVGVLVYSIV